MTQRQRYGCLMTAMPSWFRSFSLGLGNVRISRRVAGGSSTSCKPWCDPLGAYSFYNLSQEFRTNVDVLHFALQEHNLGLHLQLTKVGVMDMLDSQQGSIRCPLGESSS